MSAAYLPTNKSFDVVGKLTIQSIFSTYTSFSDIRKNTRSHLIHFAVLVLSLNLNPQGKYRQVDATFCSGGISEAVNRGLWKY